MHFCDQFVSRHRLAQAYKIISKPLNVPLSSVGSIIMKFKFGSTQTLPRAGRPAKLRKALVKEVNKNSVVTLTARQKTSIDMGELAEKGSHLRNTPSVRPLW